MNNSNPLIPQGSLLEQQQNKKRHHFKVAILCVLAANAVLISGMLLIGCRPSSESSQPQPEATPLAENTNLTMPSTDTNVTSALPPVVAPSNNTAITAPPVVTPTPPPI